MNTRIGKWMAGHGTDDHAGRMAEAQPRPRGGCWLLFLRLGQRLKMPRPGELRTHVLLWSARWAPGTWCHKPLHLASTGQGHPKATARPASGLTSHGWQSTKRPTAGSCGHPLLSNAQRPRPFCMSPEAPGHRHRPHAPAVHPQTPGPTTPPSAGPRRPSLSPAI